MDAARAADGTTNNGAGDPFSRFWMDLMSNLSTAAMGGGAEGERADALATARRAFFDAWAKHCDEFMRSPVFLEAMKRSMDAALAFKQQINEFLTRYLHENQMTTRSDTDSILLVLRSMEDRVLERIDQLTKRVETLENSGGRGTGSEPAVGRTLRLKAEGKGGP